MRFNEIISEGIGDTIRAGLYRNMGVGGPAASEIASRDTFIKTFIKQMELSMQSAESAGMPFDANRMVASYLAKYNWSADEQQKAQIKTITDKISKGITDPGTLRQLGNAMYVIGSQQIRDDSGRALGGPNAAQPAGAVAGDGKDNPVATQAIGLIDKLKGSGNVDDLTKVAKAAMTMLNQQNPAAWNQLYKEITGRSMQKQKRRK